MKRLINSEKTAKNHIQRGGRRNQGENQTKNWWLRK